MDAGQLLLLHDLGIVHRLRERLIGVQVRLARNSRQNIIVLIKWLHTVLLLARLLVAEGLGGRRGLAGGINACAMRDQLIRLVH